jgi:hypothetical protein
METVFAAVRSQPAPAARTQRPAEPAGDAGVWKEF